MSNTHRVILRVIRQYDDHDPVTLGLLVPNVAWDETATAKAMLSGLWDEFQVTEPDCDSDFIDYACKRGFSQVEDCAEDVVLG